MVSLNILSSALALCKDHCENIVQLSVMYDLVNY